MTRFVVDAAVALRVIRDVRQVPEKHQLVAPAVLRSEVLSLLYRMARTGALSETGARHQLDALAGLKIRLLADRVSRATAWKIASQLGWDDIGPAEYLAVATLQADALVAEDERLADQRLVPAATYEDLFR
jgi:predicted nucleic acid-binding protein